ncbi:MAG TPA: DUF427 domain-containing protein [Aestuariivirgaceae bacterium]|jgi:uncharacterized protein (DUF427 family)|nr:DUF427 domain-containing protein [Aestuariivirgaceae bacterium]
MTHAHKSHPISIERNPNRVRVHFNGRVVADTRAALTLREASLAPVIYIPRADADMTLLERTSHRTHCPFKSDANYYSLKVDGRTAENAVWTYEDPFPAVAAIKDHLAFYPERVDKIEELPA